MTNWKTVKERWLPIVEKMEEHGMDDYAIPEIYRAACVANTELIRELKNARQTLHNLGQGELHGDAKIIAYNAALNAGRTISKHKGD